MSRVTTYLVGRDPRCHHRLHDPSVSRRHAEVVPAPDGRFYVTDCASTGGTFVLRGREWTRIRQAWVGPSDRLRFGGHEMAAADLATPRGGRATPGSASAPAPPALDPAPRPPAPDPPSPAPPAAARDEKHRVRSPARDPRTAEIVEMREDP